MIHLRPLTAADLPFGLHLSRQAGWNQMPADWQRLFDVQPDGGFVAEWEGTPAGTTWTGTFGSVAWIAMVLVDEAHRRRGLGKALLEHALEVLDRQGVATIRLDATPQGQPLYERLGFVEQFPLGRFEGTLPSAAAVLGVETASPAHWERLAALDQLVTGTDRRALLLRLFAEYPENVRCVRHGAEMLGFLASRPGARGVQLGPCIASAEAGDLLLHDVCQRHAGQPVVIDVPVSHVAATRLAQSMGLTVQRSFCRMARGIPRGERLDCLWASAGPEKG